MTNEGRRIGWRELGETQADGLVEMSVVMRGGGRKKKKTGNPHDSLAGESEKGETGRWEKII